MNSMSEQHLSEKRLLRVYFILACFARTATSAAIVGILILSSERGIPSHQMGMLAACLNVPHLLGPIWGRWLDMAADPRRLICVAAYVYGLTLLVTTLFFDQLSLEVLGLLLVVCGASAPYLMGGISGLLNGLFGPNTLRRRQAHAWDVCSYAMGGTLGPTLIAGVTELSDTRTALITIAMLPLLSASMIATLPIQRGDVNQSTPVPSIAKVVRQIIMIGELSRTMYLTVATSFSLSALPVCAIFLAESWGKTQSSSATLISFYGIGNLVGALCLMRFPSQKEPEKRMFWSATGLSCGLLLASLSSSYSLGVSAYLLCGIANALFFAASLAARVDYAPQESASQVFMWIAALKIAAVSIGSTFSGFIAGNAPSQALMVSFAITLGFTIVGYIHKRAS